MVGEEDNFMKSLEKSIDYCMALNCKRLHIMSGRVGEETKGTENFFFLLLKGGGRGQIMPNTLLLAPRPRI